jgi:voltage-gated potassium channel
MAPKSSGALPFQNRLHEIIFEADTPEGRFFDIMLLISILASVLVVMLESVSELNDKYHHLFYIMEWVFTGLFTLEYLLRLYSVKSPWRYAGSFYGIIDLLAILPTYLSLLVTGTQYLLVIRILRLLRIFRVFKLGHFLTEGEIIIKAMKASRAKITVFFMFVRLLVTIFGAIMYLLEGETNSSFSSIPRSIYLAIVTLTTVGYGDITPEPSLGQFVSAMVMILGYAVIAVPTGIVSSEFIEQVRKPLKVTTTACPNCSLEGHDPDASYCKFCGEPLEVRQTNT